MSEGVREWVSGRVSEWVSECMSEGVDGYYSILLHSRIESGNETKGEGGELLSPAHLRDMCVQ